MNLPPPPPLPPIPVDAPAPKRPERLAATLAAAAVAVGVGDFLLWSAAPGLGLALFIVAMAALLLAHRGFARCSWRAWLTAALLLAACAQTAVEICLTNLAVVVALSLILIGETSFPRLPAGWARWWEAFIAMCAAPGRWIWLGNAIAAAPASGETQTSHRSARAMRLVRIIAPAAALAVIFAVVLGQGNVIFGDLISRLTEEVLRWITSFDLSGPRVLFWLLLATLALAIFQPAEAPETARPWTQPPPIWVRADLSLARGQSYAVLGVLNALFFTVNTIDVIYLWQHGRIPDGVNSYDFIHAGTNALITATVLSAVVLTALFQQAREVSRQPVLRALAHVWIAQNLLLLAGVGLRWKLYLDSTHLLTAKRLHLACFLGLVALGFLFLVLHIERGPDLRRLLWRNAVAVFALFFALQFVNTTGLAAHWNVSQWQRSRGWALDYHYLIRQGENAWPALVRAASSDPAQPAVREAQAAVRKIGAREATRLALQNWRARQWRRDRAAREVIAAAQRLPAE